MPRRPADDQDQPQLDFVPGERLQIDDGRGGGSQGRLLLSVALALAAVIATVVTIWYIFANQPPHADDGKVPVVSAEPGPVKTKPVEPGGMEVPNQDKLVYQRLNPGTAQPGAERLLPPPEQPQPPPADAPRKESLSLATPKRSLESLNEPPAPAAAPEPPVAAAPPAPPPEPPPPAKVEEPAPAEAPKPVQQQAEAPKPAEPTPAVAEKPAPAPAPAVAGKDGGWRIQLAAMRDEASAREAWQRLTASHAELLAGLTPDVVRADLGARGIFYRLRAGPLDETGARKLCDELGKRKIGCLVVRK